MNFTLLTYEQIAERSGLRSARTVRKWASSGQLPVVRLPSGAVRVDSRDYEKFVMDHKTAVVATPDPNKLLATLGLPKRSRSTNKTPDPSGLGHKTARAGVKQEEICQIHRHPEE